jgi:hypothetical protein
MIAASYARKSTEDHAMIETQESKTANRPARRRRRGGARPLSDPHRPPEARLLDPRPDRGARRRAVVMDLQALAECLK